MGLDLEEVLPEEIVKNQKHGGSFTIPKEVIEKHGLDDFSKFEVILEGLNQAWPDLLFGVQKDSIANVVFITWLRRPTT